MSDLIGRIPVPEPVHTEAVFPLTGDYDFALSQDRPIIVHRLGSANAKIEQRFKVGIGPRQFGFRARLNHLRRRALVGFWEARKSAAETFLYDAPRAGGGTDRYRVNFTAEPLSLEYLLRGCQVGLTFLEVPDPILAPSYAVAEVCYGFPSAALEAALLGQVQEIIPLLRIRVRENAVPDIYISDRRCTVGGQWYLPRLLNIGEPGSDVLIAQRMSSSDNAHPDDVQFTLGNADRVMTALRNDTDLRRARLEFSLFHVQSGILLKLWAGYLRTFESNAGPEFTVQASEGLYEVTLPCPSRRATRSCWKFPGDQITCFAPEGSTCDRSWKRCQELGQQTRFGGIVCNPQGVRIKDNASGVWGVGRNDVTSTSINNETIYGAALPDVWMNDDGDPKKALPVNCLVADGREEGDFYDALGIVGAGPLTFATPQMVDGDGDGKKERMVAHTLDGQPHHGFAVDANGNPKPTNSTMGLRTVVGEDPNTEPFCLGEGSPQHWDGPERAAGVAWVEIRRTDTKGFQPSRTQDHQMQAIVSRGLPAWTWSGPGVRAAYPGCTDPFWIAVNTLLRGQGMYHLPEAQVALQEALFDIDSVQSCSAIAQTLVDKLAGAGQETQWRFRGVIAETKALKDWLSEILATALGYYTWSFGRLKFGMRMNASAAEAFTAGNILFNSLRLRPIEPSFEKLIVHFADEEFAYAANTADYLDGDHAAANGRALAPLTSEMHLVGCATKSQALRLATIRTREEIGGITPAEWAAACQGAWKTTILALKTEPGMVVSLNHDDLKSASNPTGHGDFRVISRRIMRDWSIELEVRTVTPSMYDLLVGPKPFDVPAAPIPGETVLNPVPGDVEIISATQVALPSGDVGIDVVYEPPDPLEAFTGVYPVVTTPDYLAHYLADQDYNGDPAAAGDARHGTCRIVMPTPDARESWDVALASRNPSYRRTYIAPGSPSGTATPHVLVEVDPAPGRPPAPMALAAKIAGATAAVQYGVVEGKDGARVLKFRWTGAITKPADGNYLECRIEAVEAGGAVLQVGSGVDGYVGAWLDIAPGTYTLKFYSRNKENAENPDAFTLANQSVTATPALPDITAAALEVQRQVINQDTGAPKEQWRLVCSFTQAASLYQWYVRVQLVGTAGQDAGKTINLLEVPEPKRDFITDWFDQGASSTYQLQLVRVNRLEESQAAYNVGAQFTVAPMAAAPAITNIAPLDGGASLIEFADFQTDAGMKRKYRFRGQWTEGSGGAWDNYLYTQISLLPQPSGAEIVLANERDGKFQTDWFDIGAPVTYKIRFTPVNRLKAKSAAQAPGGDPSYAVTGIAAAGNVAYRGAEIKTQAVDGPSGRVKQWCAKLQCDLPTPVGDFGWWIAAAVFTAPGVATVELTGHELTGWDANHTPTSWFDVTSDCTFTIELRTYNKAGVLVAGTTILGPWSLAKDPGDIPVSTPPPPPDPSIVSCTGRLTEADAHNVRWIELTLQYDPPVNTATAPFTGVMVYVDHPDSGGGNAVLGSATLGGTATLNQAFAPQAFGPFAPVGAGRQTLQVKCPMPQQDETWAVYLVPNGKQVVRRDQANHSAYVTLSVDMTMTGGNPQPGTGVSGQEWAPLIDKATISGGGAAGAFIEYRTEQGVPQYRWNLRFTPPVDARYGGVMVQETGYGSISHPMMTLPRTAASYISPWWTSPTVPTDLYLHLLSVDPQGRQNTEVAGVTPNVAASRVCRPTAAQGQEYASGVLMPSVATNYVYNAHGRYVLQVDLTWIDPYLSQDTAYTGCVVYIQSAAEAPGGHAATGTIARGTNFQRLEISDFPASAQTWKINIRSCAGLNQNTYKAGTTPEVSFPVAPPPQGPAGREFCDLVTGQSATPTILNANADGTTQTAIRFEFAKPADPRWEGVDIRVQKVPGGSWEMAIANVSILPFGGVSYMVTTPNAVANWTFAFISHDQAGQNNSYQAGITPTATVAVGTTKKSLDVRYAAPEAYDGTVEVTGTSTITVNITAATKTIAWVSGPLFNAAWPAGMPVTIDGGGYTVASVTNSFTLTVNEAPSVDKSGVQFVAQGLFRARSITLDYNGQVTTLANESAEMTGANGSTPVTAAVRSYAGDYSVTESPGRAGWRCEIDKDHNFAGCFVETETGFPNGEAVAKMGLYGTRPDPGYADPSWHTYLSPSEIQMYSLYRGLQRWLVLQPQMLNPAVCGAYAGKITVWVGKADGSGSQAFVVPLYSS